ncbi:MAG TPA: amidohydrolase family protein [Acidimicrobiales bacterium]
MIIDAHAHISTADTATYPPGPVGGHELQPELLVNPFDAEQLIAALDEEGTDHAIVVQRGHIYGYDNRYVCDSSAAHPGRLSAVVSVDANDPKALESIDYWVSERGARGIRLAYPGRRAPGQQDDTSWFTSDVALGTWRRAEELGIPVCIHFSRWNQSFGIEPLGEIVLSMPNLSVVVDHLANCAVESGPPVYGMTELDPLDHPNVVFKVVPINFKFLRQAELDSADFLRRAVDRFGSDRLMFGSDVTNSVGTHQELLAAGIAASAQLEDKERDDFLGGTVARIYGLSLVG